MNGNRKWALLLLLWSAHLAFADVQTIDFEGRADGTSVTSQFPGLLFSNATIVAAGVSLNAAEFPPHSGINAVIDDGGSISIVFSPDILSFQAFFTYLEPLTATAYNSGNPVDVANSLFSSNFVSSGNTPNEEISVSSVGGIDKVVIAGDPNGFSFVMDDVTITTSDLSSVPEASSVALLATLLVLAGAMRGVRKATRGLQP